MGRRKKSVIVPVLIAVIVLIALIASCVLFYWFFIKDPKEEAACNYAREKSSIGIWQQYLVDYPKGMCAKEAYDNSCEIARRGATIDIWVEYLKYFPNTDCAKEAEGASYKYARDKKQLSEWKKYTMYFPDATHIFEANQEIQKLTCDEARKVNTIKKWEEYLEKYPKGICAGEGKDRIEEIKAKKVEPKNVSDGKNVNQSETKPDGNKSISKKKWSSKSSIAMTWKQAVKYCENLKENGSSDWRLPTISELRTLITKCASTETGGACGVTDSCLSQNSCKNDACKGCGDKVRHNKLGDKGLFWSSSINSENNNAWYIDFTYASIHGHSNSEKFVRCVR